MCNSGPGRRTSSSAAAHPLPTDAEAWNTARGTCPRPFPSHSFPPTRQPYSQQSAPAPAPALLSSAVRLRRARPTSATNFSLPSGTHPSAPVGRTETSADISVGGVQCRVGCPRTGRNETPTREPGCRPERLTAERRLGIVEWGWPGAGVQQGMGPRRGGSWAREGLLPDPHPDKKGAG